MTFRGIILAVVFAAFVGVCGIAVHVWQRYFFSASVVSNFARYEAKYQAFVNDVVAGNAELKVNGEFVVPEQLKKCRVGRISLNDDGIYFEHLPEWPDDAQEAIIFDTLARETFKDQLRGQYLHRTVYCLERIGENWYYLQYN